MRRIVEQAVKDAISIATDVANLYQCATCKSRGESEGKDCDGTCWPEDTFRKYFREDASAPMWGKDPDNQIDERAKVARMFANLAGIISFDDIDGEVVGQDEFGHPVLGTADFEVYLGAPGKTVYKWWGCEDKGIIAGATVPGTEEEAKILKNAHIEVCPHFFNFPDLGEMKCEDLGNKAGSLMMSRGSHMLHELLHWGRLTDSWRFVGPSKLDDSEGLFSIPIPGNPVPLTVGYGAYNAQALAKVDSEAWKYKYLTNVENYLYFALEIYWAKRCWKKRIVRGGQSYGFFNPPDIREQKWFNDAHWGYDQLEIDLIINDDQH